MAIMESHNINCTAPDGACEAAPGHVAHPGEVHHDDPGVEADPWRAVVGDGLHRVVNVLSRRHPHHLARAEVVKMSPQTLKQFNYFFH